MARPSVVVAGSTWIWVAIPAIRVGAVVRTLCLIKILQEKFMKKWCCLCLTPLLVPEFVVDFPPPGIFKVKCYTSTLQCYKQSASNPCSDDDLALGRFLYPSSHCSFMEVERPLTGSQEIAFIAQTWVTVNIRSCLQISVLVIWEKSRPTQQIYILTAWNISWISLIATGS